MVSAAFLAARPVHRVPDRWMMVAALSSTRNSANYHSEPVDRVRPAVPSRASCSVPVVRPPARPPVSLRDRAPADRGWPMRSLLRLTSDATRESLKCMATQLVNNERKKNCRREYENARPAARQGRQSTGGAL